MGQTTLHGALARVPGGSSWGSNPPETSKRLSLVLKTRPGTGRIELPIASLSVRGKGLQERRMSARAA